MGGFERFHQKRKYSSQADIETVSLPKKRIRLESLLGKLSIEEPSPFRINPLVNTAETQTKNSNRVNFDTFISERMIDEYNRHVLRGFALLRYAHPFTVIVRHFQQWVKRLFNTFVRKYNERCKGERFMRPFRDFSRIIALTRDPKIAFTYQDLLSIVLEENALEALLLSSKKDKKLNSDQLQEIHDEEELARESSYTYWDRVSRLSGDVDMEDICEDSFLPEYKRGISHSSNAASDFEMEVDVDTGCSVEANYGTYYGASHTNFFS